MSLLRVALSVILSIILYICSCIAFFEVAHRHKKYIRDYDSAWVLSSIWPLIGIIWIFVGIFDFIFSCVEKWQMTKG